MTCPLEFVSFCFLGFLLLLAKKCHRLVSELFVLVNKNVRDLLQIITESIILPITDKPYEVTQLYLLFPHLVEELEFLLLLEECVKYPVWLFFGVEEAVAELVVVNEVDFIAYLGSKLFEHLDDMNFSILRGSFIDSPRSVSFL